MKLLLLSVFGMGMAMSVMSPAPDPESSLETRLEKELGNLKSAVDSQTQLMNDLFREGAILASDDGDPGAPVVEEAPKTGLQAGGLVGSSLQPSRGLQGGARGLTPVDEWRRMFPHPVGYSR